MTDTVDNLQRAIEYLGFDSLECAESQVQEVAPGFYAFLAPDPEGGKSRWRVASRKDMVKLGNLLPRGDDDYPPEWEMDEAIMPSWWTPERRFARRCTGGGVEQMRCGALVPDFEKCPANGPHCMGYYQRITADLETGQEVPA